MIYIPHVEFEFLMPGYGVATVTLCPAGDAGTHFVTARLLGSVEREILHQQRPRADQRHVAFEDVPELWQLVDGRGADKTTNLRQALRVRQQFAVGIAFVSHGLELHDLEDFAVLAGTFLEEESASTFVGEMQPYRHSCQRHGQHNQRATARGNVDRPLEKFLI